MVLLPKSFCSLVGIRNLCLLLGLLYFTIGCGEPPVQVATTPAVSAPPAAGQLSATATMPLIMDPTSAAPVLAPTFTPATNGIPAPASGQPVPPIPTGTLVDALYLDTYTVDAINGLSGSFYPPTNYLPARYIVDRYQIRFRTFNERRELAPIRAELYVPRAEVITQFPIFVYGAGTTGINNQCAPLDEMARSRNWGNYRTHMLSYAAQGYIAILPLWQGYDDPARTHLYFIAELEGPILLDATRAVYQFFQVVPDTMAKPAAAVFFGGYSQGGHGAFSADAIATAYASELPIKGIIGHASAPSVEALLRERPPLSPYIVYAYRNYYGLDVIDPVQVFLPNWLPTLDVDASTKCVDEVYDYYPGNANAIYRPEFSASLYGGRLAQDFPFFKQTLDINDVGRTTNPAIPALLLHGADDPIVTPQTNLRFMQQMCQLGKSVTYYLYPGVNHFGTRQHSFVDTLNWMQNIMAGGVPRADCAMILGQ